MFANPAIANSPRFSEMFVARTPQAAKMWAQTQMAAYGWNGKAEWLALEKLWTYESNWRPNAKNHTPVKMLVNKRWVKLYAGGIPQRLGLNPKTPVKAQIRAGMDYVKARYGSPVKALGFWKRHFWY